MVAIALPPPRQLPLFAAPPTASEATPLPVVSESDVRRLLWSLRRMAYGDALVCDDYRLERQHFQHIADDELDDAADGTLVVSSYVQFVLLARTPPARRRLRVPMAVVEVRQSARTLDGLLARLARRLLVNGWQVEQTRLLVDGALLAPTARVDRVRRLIEKERR